MVLVGLSSLVIGVAKLYNWLQDRRVVLADLADGYVPRGRIEIAQKFKSVVNVTENG
jgi:hypothetical protein